MSADVEIKQGKAIVDAAKVFQPQDHIPLKPSLTIVQQAGVQHFVWSSLLNVTELSGGKLAHVEHFDSKAAIEVYIREIGIPASFFLPGFYMKNLPGGMFRQLPPNNDWTLGLPIPGTAPVPLLDAAEDTGKFVKGILLHREKTLGKRIYGATDYYTLDQIVAQFKELYPEAGNSAKVVELPQNVFKGILAQAGQSEEGATELTENMLLMNDFGYYGGADLKESHEVLVDKLTTWKDFMAKSEAFATLK